MGQSDELGSFPGIVVRVPVWVRLRIILTNRQGHETASLPERDSRTGFNTGMAHWPEPKSCRTMARKGHQLSFAELIIRLSA